MITFDIRDDEEPIEPQEYAGPCPYCKATNTRYGYGLAGGGCGAYSFCECCGRVFDKVQDEMEKK